MTSDDEPWAVQPSPGAVRALDRLPHKVVPAVEAGALRVPRMVCGAPRRLPCDVPCALRALEDDRVLYIGRVEHRAHVYRRQ